MGGVFNSFNFAVFGYANNNPVKYNDPTGESPALAVAIPAAGKTVGAVAVSIGPVGWVVIGAVAVVGVGIALYNYYANSADKENEQAIPRATAKEKALVVGATLLYRTVNSAELESIITSGGKFSMGDNTTYETGKLFQTNPADAYAYAVLANKTIAKDDPYTAIVSTLAPEGSYIPVDPIIDAPSAVIVPATNLSLLSPASITPLPLEN